MYRVLALAALMLALLAACGSPPMPAAISAATEAPTSVPRRQALSSVEGESVLLRLATTTSTADSGLLDAILPDFEQRYNAEVQVVAVGTGQALKLGEQGDADVLLVHARAREDEFLAKGFGVDRRDVMYNDFVIVGPPNDPAQIRRAARASDAFKQIAAQGAVFASRGDDSGTFTKEQAIWASTGMTPTADLGWYKSLGQGMGETLQFANEQRAYTLTDRGTYLSMRDSLANLAVVFGGATIQDNGDAALRNPYGVITVNPQRYPAVNAALATSFEEWITSPEVQQMIGDFGKDKYGQPLFYPVAAR